MTSLQRSLSLPVLTFYGLGTMIGAGIYVLIGKVISYAGQYAPLSFLAAGCIALFTALSYAELSSRFPKSAGAALYAQKAWNRPTISAIMGWCIIATGIASAATISHGFAGYITIFFSIKTPYAITIMVLLLMMIAMIGMNLSAWFVIIITLLEIGGLIWVCSLGLIETAHASASYTSTLLPNSPIAGIISASFLAFYAFIGFEDMVNTSEEVKRPRQTVPRAIIISVSLSCIIYFSVALVITRITDPAILLGSVAPISDIVQHAGFSPTIITAISLIAVSNGALVQIIMASRMMYGMANQHIAPQFLGNVHRYFKTPVYATLMTGVLIILSALLLPLEDLAFVTSTIMLLIYFLVNIALITIKSSPSFVEPSTTTVPMVIPIIGAVLCMGLIIIQWINI